MVIRCKDGTDVKYLSNGSHKKILFNCDSCDELIEQSYRNYLNQKDGKFCRKCRNKHTANRPDVKEKQSITSKENWKNNEYREKISKSLSIGCKKSWSKNDNERRKNMSKNNPMYNKNVCEKVREKITETKQSIIDYMSSIGYQYIKHERLKNKVIVEYKCDKGHMNQQRLNDLRDHHRCKICSNQRSYTEIDIVNNILTYYNGLISLNDRTIVKNTKTNKMLELDIYLPEINFAIECNSYYHTLGENVYKDKLKMDVCRDKGITLYEVMYNDWVKNKEKIYNEIKRIICSKLTIQ